MIKKYLVFLYLSAMVQAHGFLWSPVSSLEFSARGAEALAAKDWNHLKNPVRDDSVCRGEPMGKITELKNLKDGQEMSIMIAKQNNHIGDCFVYVLDENLQNPVLIGESINKYSCTELKRTDYNCVEKINSTPYDYCLTKWTFKVQNSQKITCKNCVLQWKWTAKHVNPYEHFENCADISFATLNATPTLNNSLIESKPKQSLKSSSDNTKKCKNNKSN